MKKEKWLCDIDECSNGVSEENRGTEIQVIFLTEQTEGRSCKPHLSLEKFDICDKCLAKLLKGHVLYGAGAQGHNNYEFRK